MSDAIPENTNTITIEQYQNICEQLEVYKIKLASAENIIKKELLRARDRELALKEKNDQLTVIQEELQQSQEETIAQRDYILLQNEVMSEKNRMIESSIRAAKLIQSAMLPHHEELQGYFPEHFVLYEPRDIVSGDFYWVSSLTESTILLAVADCTGHGVPGAFMSIVGSSILDKIVNMYSVRNPDEILFRLHDEILHFLRQKETKDRNGMDISIITVQSIADQHYKINYAGAKTELIYQLPTNTQQMSISGDRAWIGGYYGDKVQEFTNQELIVPKGTMLYLFSDGYIDQNDKERHKIGKAMFRNLLQQAADMSVLDQYELLKEYLSKQLQDTTQRDDITIVGIRL
jgi:serine phosphatase RsbU (regulator of sigma subunit)